jgi:hypothetical protein
MQVDALAVRVVLRLLPGVALIDIRDLDVLAGRLMRKAPRFAPSPSTFNENRPALARRPVVQTSAREISPTIR